MKFKKLESIRGMAAIYVMLGHTLMPYFKSSKLSILLSFGQEAVILFFILSGFVIYYASSSRKSDGFKVYFIKRFRRIYPLFIISLIISYVLACIDQRSLIFINTNELLGNLLMLQDFAAGKPGIWFNSFLGNPSLWSLSYEWWFYILFFIINKLLPKNFQLNTAIIISFLGYITYFIYPNKISITLMYLIIWWSGVEICREYLSHKQVTFFGQTKTLITLSILCISLLVQVFIYKGNLSFGIHPFLEFRHFFACIFIIVIGIYWQNLNFYGFKYTISFFSFFAPISYGIYILHYPLMVSFNIFGKNTITGFLISLLITFYLAYILEIKIQNKINNLSLKFFD